MAFLNCITLRVGMRIKEICQILFMCQNQKLLNYCNKEISFIIKRNIKCEVKGL